MWRQFPDLTESYSSSAAGSIVTLDTQFMFCTTSPSGDGQTIKSLIKAGFKCVSSMNNWNEGHSEERRRIDLWWYRRPEKQLKPKIPNGNKLSRTYPTRQATGCGFNVSDQCQHEFYWRYHTLLRMPVSPSPAQLKWLNKCHYFKLDESKFSSYWTNGFPPKDYSWKLEEKYWTDIGVSVDARKSMTPKKAERVVARQRKIYDKQMKKYQEQQEAARLKRAQQLPPGVLQIPVAQVDYVQYNWKGTFNK